MFDVVKEHYFESIALRERIESRANFRAGLVVALGSATLFIFRNYRFTEEVVFLDWVVSMCLVTAAGALVHSGYNLSRMLIHSVKYEFVPAQEEMIDYKDDILEQNPVSPQEATQETKRDLEPNYAGAADTNFRHNKTKASWVHWAGYGIVVAGTALLIAAVPYGWQKVNKPASLSQQGQGSTMPKPKKEEKRENGNSRSRDYTKPKPLKNKRIHQNQGPETAEEVDASGDEKNES